jgi:hypothetical protein
MLLLAGAVVAVAGPAHAAGRPTALAAGRAIPDSAFLQPEDLRGATPTRSPDDAWPALRPPRPCATGGPGAASPRAEGTVSFMIGVGDRPTVVMEHLATYRSNGASRYVRDLHRALTRCGGCTEPDRVWTVLATDLAGDGSLLISVRETVEYAGELMTKDSYVVVARVGRAVVVLADVGWETGNGHEALVRELIGPAVRRAARLR